MSMSMGGLSDRPSSFYKVMLIVNNLMKTDRNQLAKRINKINAENKKLQRVGVDGFIFEGIIYYPRGESYTADPPIKPKTPLHKDLYLEMNEYFKEEQELGANIIQIRQCLTLMFEPCVTPQDYRDAIPECIFGFADKFDKYSKLSRTRPETWMLGNNIRALKLYEKTLPLMQVYSTSHLFF